LEAKTGMPVIEPEEEKQQENDLLINPEKYGEALYGRVAECLWDRCATDDINYGSPVAEEDELFGSHEFQNSSNELRRALLTDIIKVSAAKLASLRECHHQTSQFASYDKKDYKTEMSHTLDNESFYRQESHETLIERSIREMAAVGETESINFLLEFWGKNRDPLYGPALADTISKIDPSGGAQKVLERLQAADQQDQRRLLSLLYRLELGRVGISEEGLDYLGRRFDLGQFNNPHGFAQRMTADGKVGVFGANRALEGFVQLEAADFSGDPTESHRKEVLDVTYEMLFTPRPDETSHERAARERILESFKANYFDTYLRMFAQGEQDHGLHFNNLSLPEQGFALQFLIENQGDRAQRDRFFQFLAKYGEDGFFAFRSSEFDPNAAGKILKLDQTENSEYLRHLFSAYRETYHLSARVADHVMQMLQGQDNTLEVNLIRENILMAAQQHLTDDSEGTGLMDLMNLNGILVDFLYEYPPTIDGFIEGQDYLGPFLADNLPKGSVSPEYLAPNIIAGHLQRLYDNPEFNLRDFEGKTTDTGVSLSYLSEVLDDRQLRETADNPEQLTVYDVGAGEGRIAIPLSQEGHRVVGIDISPRMVSQVPERVAAEGGDSSRVDIREGNFFDFDSAKFDQAFGPEKADAAVIMWHTFGFAGDHEGQMRALKNVFDNLRPGGKVLIEMPDRTFGGYARALRQFHAEHPETPFGTMVDAPSTGAAPSEQNQAISSPRYFPSRTEMEELLKEVGFVESFRDDYFVRAQNGEGQTLAIKENLFVGQKPIDQERMARLSASPESSTE
jgi:SAM-dependent methyltransferase